MASPNGLRLFLGSRPPADVLDNIFAYGFHLWLAKPVDVITDYGFVTNDLDTDRAVLAEDLSERARTVVNFDRYFIGNQYGPQYGERVVRVEYARPRVAAGVVRDPLGNLLGWTVWGAGDGQPSARIPVPGNWRFYVGTTPAFGG